MFSLNPLSGSCWHSLQVYPPGAPAIESAAGGGQQKQRRGRGKGQGKGRGKGRGRGQQVPRKQAKGKQGTKEEQVAGKRKRKTGKQAEQVSEENANVEEQVHEGKESKVDTATADPAAKAKATAAKAKAKAKAATKKRASPPSESKAKPKAATKRKSTNQDAPNPEETEAPPASKAKRTSKAKAKANPAPQAPSFHDEGKIEEMISFAQKWEQHDDTTETRKAIRASLASPLKWNIYWKRPGCGIGFKKGLTDFGYYAFTGDFKWIHSISVACKACDMLAS